MRLPARASAFPDDDTRQTQAAVTGRGSRDNHQSILLIMTAEVSGATWGSGSHCHSCYKCGGGGGSSLTPPTHTHFSPYF